MITAMAAAMAKSFERIAGVFRRGNDRPTAGRRQASVTAVPEDVEERHRRLERLRREKELENFWRYDGTDQEEIRLPELL